MTNSLLKVMDSGKQVAPELGLAVFALSSLLDHAERVQVTATPEVSVDHKGVIQFDHHLSTQTLLALEGLDVNRFRRCEVCDRLFYAPRKDSRGCTDRHQSTLRQREYRKPTQ